MKECCKIAENKRPNRFLKVLRRLFWVLFLGAIAVLALVDWVV